MMANGEYFSIQSPYVASVRNLFFSIAHKQNVLIEFKFHVLHSFSHRTYSSIRKIHHRSSEMYLLAEIKFLQQR